MLIFKRFRMKYRREISTTFKFFFSFLSIITLFFLTAVVFEIFIPKDNFILNLLTDFNISRESALLQFNAAIILILTIVIILGGWKQIHNAYRISKDDLLLRIDFRYTRKEIVKARTIIHEIYVSFDKNQISRTDKITKTSAIIEKMK